MDTLKSDIPEKTSAWTDEEREHREATPEKPTLPPWLPVFTPGTVITHQGWTATVRHVGCEEGRWLLLVEPAAAPIRQRYRSEYRRLVVQVGKKEAKRRIREKVRAFDSEPRS